MKMILQCDMLTVVVDPEHGGDVTALCPGVKPDFNSLDRRGLQCWLKAGDRRDALSGVLRSFHDRTMLNATFDVESQSDSAVTMAARSHGLILRKAVRLEGQTLCIVAEVTNTDLQPTGQLQIEHVNHFHGGSMPERPHTALVKFSACGKPDQPVFLEPFGQRFV